MALLLHREVVAEGGVFVLLVAVRGPPPDLDLDMTMLVLRVRLGWLLEHQQASQGQHEDQGEQVGLSGRVWDQTVGRTC